MRRVRPGVAAAPTPGIVWGLYPQHADADRPRPAPFGRMRDRLDGVRRYRDLARAAKQSASTWEARAPLAYDQCLNALRARLRRDGLVRAAISEALGCVADAARRTLGARLFPEQLFAAAALLDGCLAEMATGEGKTYAAAAAAAVAALAGIPVHVITANDYLVGRDAAALAPWYTALGLRTGSIVQALGVEERRTHYQADIVYCTARELVFDYLRDGLEQPARRHELLHRASALSANPPQPRLRGLCMAILDEADNALLDEAVTPLVLSQTYANPDQRAFLWQALSLARQLRETDDFRIERATRRALLSERGRERITLLSADLGAAWRLRRRAEETIETALAALHLYRRDRDYLVQDDRITIIDPHTGRAAPGRVWSHGLHHFVELKESTPLSADTHTIAQITYQRFFPRYLRLAGMSGTLREARRELRSVYGLRVVEVPLRKPLRRMRLPTRLIGSSAERWAGVSARVRTLHGQGRPVLIGTDSVADSEALAAVLTTAGIAHSVLNARRDREEAAIVAAAGGLGAVTIATHMAGRGTDIALATGVLALGGLHVINCLTRAPRRLERQLEGRCARQGDPGSCERWICLEAAAHGERIASILGSLVRYYGREGIADRLQWLLRLCTLAQQRSEERRCAEQRRLVLQQDREWERRCSFTLAAE